MTDLAPALTDAKDHAVTAWYRFTRERSLHAVVPDWRTGTSPDGSPHLTVEVVGPDAATALHEFAADYLLALGSGDRRPGFDYSTPGRTTCVWRTHGVWVEMWVSDTAPAHSAAPVPPRPIAVRLLSHASGRLPFTRNRRLKKETTA